MRARQTMRHMRTRPNLDDGGGDYSCGEPGGKRRPTVARRDADFTGSCPSRLTIATLGGI